MKVFRAEKGDVFTSFKPDDASFGVWCYRGKKSANVEDFSNGYVRFANGLRDSEEQTMTTAQVNAWAAANSIRIKWPEESFADRLAAANIPPHLKTALKKCAESLPDDQPATVKESLTVPPLTFREQAAIAAMAAMISCCRVNNLGVAHGDDFDSSYFNRETGMDHDQMNGTYDGCKEIAADAWVFAEHLEAERVARGGGR